MLYWVLNCIMCYFIRTIPVWKTPFLAHLSQKLIGELLVYKGNRRLSVFRRPSVRRPSVRPSTFSNDISSETVRPILSILHI